jgi:hypothetical protein
MDKWAHLGHKLGECWHKSNITYLHIPKNASSFVKGCLINSGWQHSDTFVKADQYLVVLRDPLERWLSGMAEFQVNSGQSELDIETAFKTITFDDHTEQQIYFLKGVDLINTTFLKCNSDLRKNLNKFMLENGFNLGVANVPNINTRDTVKQTIIDRLRHYIDVYPEFKDCIKDHFAVDYKLYESVKFYD